MADPLSIAASIGGVISLADVVYLRLKKIVKYAKKVKDAADDIETLAAEVSLISGTLHRLSLLAKALEDETADPTLRIEHIQGCSRILAKIEGLVSKALEDLEGPSTFDALQRKLKWPFSSSVVAGLMGELSIHKDSITLALSADTMSGLLENLAMTAKIECSVNEISVELSDMRKITTRIQEDSERRKILEFFGQVNPQKYYDASLGLRHPLTGLWLLELPEFKTWLSEPGSKLWLRGIPGAGKTVLAGNMIEKALGRSSVSSAVAFFFCDYRDSETLEVVNILGALVSQLARQGDAAYQLLETYYSELHPATSLPKRPSVDGLKSLLAEMAALYGSTYVIVDGLDECEKQLRSVVQALLPEAGNQQSMSVAILSRDEPDIRRTIGDRFVELEILAHSEDLAHYVAAQIAERLQAGRLRFNDPLLKHETGQALIKGAGGMFRWVACQLDHLEECHSDSECREALTRLPPGLPETYTRILQRINKIHAQRVEMSLNFIAYSNPRLTLNQLREILSIPKRGRFEPSDMVHEEAISIPCSSLIRKLPDGSAFVFAHKSVQEFLEDQSYLDEHDLGHFKISKHCCSLLLARELLRFLLLPNFNIRLPSTTNEHLDLLTKNQDRYELLSYASGHWTDYSRGLWNDHEIHSLGLKLFDRFKTPSFVHWASIYLQVPFHRAKLGKIIPLLLHRDFRPLHMAAALALEELCEPLLRHTPVDLRSPIGTAVQCAISGLRSFDSDLGLRSTNWGEFHYKYEYEARMDTEGEFPTHWVPKTIQYLAARDPDFTKAPFQRQGESCIASAFITARLLRNVGVVCEVLDAGAWPEEDEMDTYQDSLDSLDDCLPEHRSGLEQDFQRLVQTLHQQIEDSPASLRLCSIVWNKARQWGLPFSFDQMNVSSQVSMNEEDLERLAFSAVRSTDSGLLRYVLEDPRADLPKMQDESQFGDTLIHAVMRADSEDMDISQQQTILLKLIQGGCDPLAVNELGETPLHLWAWSTSDEFNAVIFDEVVSIFVAAKFDIGSVSISEDNVFHDYVYQVDESGEILGRLKAMLEGFPAESVGQALFHANNHGHTPLIFAMNSDLEDTAVLMLSHCKPAEHPQAAREKLLSATLESGSASVIQRLVELDAETFHGEDVHPLHRIQASATIRWVQVLKSIVPLDCEKRVDGRLPVEVYLRECFETATAPNLDILKQLGTESTPEKALVWKFYADTVARRPGPNAQNNENSDREAAQLAGVHLIDLGYSSAFETEFSSSALQPILCPFGQDKASLWLFITSTKLLALLVDGTKYWASVIADPIMSHKLLMIPFICNHKDFLQNLLEKGVSLEARENGKTALEHMCSIKTALSDNDQQGLFDVVFRYLRDYPLNEPNRSSRLTLLHMSRQPKSPWLVRKLLSLGADPNIRGGSYHDTPLAFHLCDYGSSSLETHRVLLRAGADPTLKNKLGINVLLLASYHGHPQVLEELESFANPPWTLDWNSKTRCTGPGFSLRAGNCYQVACLTGRIDVLEFFESRSLIDDPVRTTTREEQFTPLHIAAASGHIDVIEHLVAKGANLAARARNNATPLHLAIQSGQLGAVRKLLDCGASPGRLFGFQEPISLARRTNNEAIVAILRQAIDSAPITSNNLDPRSMACAIEGAVQKNDLDCCRALIAQGCMVDTDLSCGGCSPLLEAIRAQQPGIARWLLGNGASASKEACVKHGVISALPASLSIRSPQDPELIKLIAARFCEEGGDIFDPVHIRAAITSGNETHLDVLLKDMEICKDKQSEKRTNQTWDLRNIWTMMESSPHFNATDPSPLIFAIRQGSVWAVNLLLEHGAGTHFSRNGQLPVCLMTAVTCGNPEMVKGLKSPVSKIMGLVACGYDTWIVLLWACSQRPSQISSEELIDQLLQRGTDHSMADFNGRTAVIHAADAGRVQTLARLVQAGANPHHVDNSGLSAIHVAMGNAQFTTLLLNGNFAIETSSPIPWGVRLDIRQSYGMVRAHKLYRKRLPAHDFGRIFNLEPATGWSSLCLACSEIVNSGTKLSIACLLDLGAQINYDGSPYGSALMVACSANKVEFAKLLVRGGAALVIRMRDGTFVSALAAARQFPELVAWLLSHRFMDQAKITASPAAERAEHGQPSFVYCRWSGPIKAAFIPTTRIQRMSHESSIMYLIRMHNLRNWAKGKVVTLNHRGADLSAIEANASRNSRGTSN
ncbi:hypothetical protein RB595_006978 [Gaeumannomyces hyphopodioides]